MIQFKVLLKIIEKDKNVLLKRCEKPEILFLFSNHVYFVSFKKL